MQRRFNTGIITGPVPARHTVLALAALPKSVLVRLQKLRGDLVIPVAQGSFVKVASLGHRARDPCLTLHWMAFVVPKLTRGIWTQSRSHTQKMDNQSWFRCCSSQPASYRRSQGFTPEPYHLGLWDTAFPPSLGRAWAWPCLIKTSVFFSCLSR